jgi:hypothetical protein
MRRALLGLLPLLVLGCGGRQETPAPAPAGRGGAPAATPTSGTEAAPYEVHEWGLLRAGAGDVLEAGAISPPGRYAMPIAVDKPVLYFHATAPVQLEQVRVEAIGGAIREHWPLATSAVFPASLVWRGLQLDPADAAGGARCAGVFPSPSARPCADLARGEECESRGLAAVVSPSATCVLSDGARSPFLFYRSRTSTFTPPLRVRALPSGDVEVTNTGAAPIPGWIVRMRRGGGQVRTLAVRGPGARATVTIGSDFASPVVPAADGDESEQASDQPALPGSQEPGRQGVRLTLRALGLDGGEVLAFLRAWDDTLFGERIVELVDLPPRDTTASDRRGAIDVLSANDESMPNDGTTLSDTLLYFLPEASCDGVASLSFVPAPSRVRRALAVWQPVR